MQGTILGGNEKGDEIDFEKEDGSKAQLRQSRAAGYVFAQPAKRPPADVVQGPRCFRQRTGRSIGGRDSLRDRSQDRVRRCREVFINRGLLEVRLLAGKHRVSLRSGSAVDAPEPPMDEKGLGSTRRGMSRDRGLAGEPLKLGARSSRRDCCVAPDTMLTYTIGGDYREFKTMIGIPETTSQCDLEAKVTIEADGRMLL